MDFLSSIDSGYLLNSLSEAFVIIDSNGLIQFNNTACDELFGYTKNELLHKNINILMPATDAEKHNDYIRNFRNDVTSKTIGSALDRPLTGKRKDQSLFPIDVKITTLKQDKETYVIGVIRNLSSLINSQNKLNQVLSSTDTILYTLELDDKSLRTSWVSPNITALLGYTLEEVFAENWWVTHIHPDDKDKALNNFDNFLQTEVLEHEYRFQTKNNGYIWFQDKLKLDRQYDPHLIYGSWNNITERKHQLSSLMKSKDRLSQSQIFANIGTWDWNVQTGELYWSEMIAPLFGYPEGQLETSYVNFVNSIHPEDKELVLDAINECLEHNSVYDIEHRVIWPDGSVRWVHEKGASIADSNGAPLHMLGVITDIHERKTLLIQQEQNQLELIEAKELAEAANKAKTIFLSSMSHELRTPLNAILGFSQLLQMDSSLNDEATENVSDIIQSGQHLLSLINDVLDLAKIESGKAVPSIEAISIIDLFDICKTMTSSLSEEYNIDVEFTPGCQDDYFVQADFSKLKQVIFNLLSNAIKYNNKNGHVLVDCIINKDDNTATIIIKDNGPGMSASDLSQLFIPFSRLGAEGTSRIAGSGIGLVITKNLLNLIGSDLKVNSTPGVGSEFSFKVPLLSDLNTNTSAL